MGHAAHNRLQVRGSATTFGWLVSWTRTALTATASGPRYTRPVLAAAVEGAAGKVPAGRMTIAARW
ncbi:hypothetical protein GCM10011576_41210 [Micromonospora parathelypteridis]|nr:hypothetical protein GCM10011576_41210 [Micromonospora parathelypteridis]